MGQHPHPIRALKCWQAFVGKSSRKMLVLHLTCVLHVILPFPINTKHFWKFFWGRKNFHFWAGFGRPPPRRETLRPNSPPTFPIDSLIYTLSCIPPLRKTKMTSDRGRIWTIRTSFENKTKLSKNFRKFRTLNISGHFRTFLEHCGNGLFRWYSMWEDVLWWSRWPPITLRPLYRTLKKFFWAKNV